LIFADSNASKLINSRH